jgi:hypothetical protein
MLLPMLSDIKPVLGAMLIYTVFTWRVVSDQGKLMLEGVIIMIYCVLQG